LAAIALKAAASSIARDARALRFMVIPALLSPAINREYESPSSRHAALILMIHNLRKSPFLSRLSLYA